jgi:L-threonylcarbamoyladenylate synthase
MSLTDLGASREARAFFSAAFCYADRVATDLIEIDPENPSEEAVDQACALVRRGKVVSIPTDALYTLIADPFNLHAVSQVFQAKGRELNRSLPLLVNDLIMVEELSREVSKRFYLLARRFWPGPLTIIIQAAKIPLKVTGNTGRLAVRQSRSKVANAVIERLGQPVIATSANISGSPTCTTGIDVFVMMDGRVDLVLDGGPCAGEGASTVDITEPYWRMIKEGAVKEKEVAECLQGS